MIKYGANANADAEQEQEQEQRRLCIHLYYLRSLALLPGADIWNPRFLELRLYSTRTTAAGGREA